MSNAASRFYDRVKAKIHRETDLADFFVYHITIELKNEAAKVQGVRACYEACDLFAPSWLASHFSNVLKSVPRRFVKTSVGYRLENRRREQIADLIGEVSNDKQESHHLNRLEKLIPVGPKRDFLNETVNCYGIGANRAAIVMCWNLALHHLQEYVLAHDLAAFNKALALNTDKRVKISQVTKRDDFTEMPEGKFLEFCRTARIMTSGMFKKMEHRLDERNSAAHPSGVVIPRSLTESYIEDLVENVVLKFVV
ncbi:MAG TPA: hypothetical protein VND94_11725 [Terriglobia bacterium]|nr:hypothetical protein [Terriglobia bacterium]